MLHHPNLAEGQSTYLVDSVIDFDSLKDPIAEKLLAVACMSSDVRHALPDLVDKLTPDEFQDVRYGSVWRATRSLLTEGRRISKRSLLAELSDIPTRVQLLDSLQGEWCPEESLAPAVESVKEHARFRSLREKLIRSAQMMTDADSYDEAVEFAYQQLQSLDGDASMPLGPVSFQDAAEKWLDWLNEDPEDIRVFPTPWPDLNQKLAGGLHSKRTYYVGARPGNGKTLGLFNIAQHCAEAGSPTLVISLEMPETEAVSRMMAAGAEAEYGQITRREVDDENLRRLSLYYENRVEDTKLWILDKSGLTIEKIWSIAKRMKASTHGLDVMALDYVGLVRGTDKQDGKRQQLAHITGQLSIMAKELDIAIVIAAQLNRGPEQEQTRPKPSDLRDGGSQEQDADVILLLHHEKIDGMGTGEVQVIIGKNRTGPADVTIDLPFRPHRARIG